MHDSEPASSPIRVAVGGVGGIGFEVCRALLQGIPGLTLTAASARDANRARGRLGSAAAALPMETLGELAALAHVVVECAPAAVYDEVARPAVEAGRVLITMSSGALLSRQDLIDRAKQTGARIIVPSGGILGLDALNAAAEDDIHSVTLITRKPPASLAGAPYLAETGRSMEGLTEAEQIFEGNAEDAAHAFPANINVAATLSLAGIGPRRTRVEIWADPMLEGTLRQAVRVESSSASFEIQLSSYPLPQNPRTGSLTPRSVIAALRSLTTHFRVGT